DRAGVILCAAQPSPVTPEPVTDFTSLQNAVREAQATEERTDPAAAVSLAVEQLAKTNSAVHRLYIFSDFQRTNWADVKFDAIPADTKVLFVSTDAAERENRGLTGLRLRPTAPRVGETV